MERATAIILLSFIGLFTIFSIADGCNCKINHPQERFCEASFAFVGRIKHIEVVDIDGLNFMKYTVEYSRTEVFKGKRLLSRDRFNQILLTPFYGSLCGRSNLRRGLTYLLTGTFENDSLMVSFCDWIEDWSKVTDTQKEFLRDGMYDSHCSDDCKIYGTNRFVKYNQNLYSDFVNELQMSGYWTMRECHYNPIASVTFGSPDCETDMSYCAFDSDAGMCLWKWSSNYGTCFNERETMWQILKGARPAFTNIMQCREITNEKLKKKCRKSIIRQKKLERKERKQRKQEANGSEVQYDTMPLDLDLD